MTILANTLNSSVIIIDIKPEKDLKKSYYGSIFRGWFGSMLKCDPRKKCIDCNNPQKCPYFMVFKNQNDIKPYSLLSFPNDGHIRNLIKIYGETRVYIPQILSTVYKKGKTSHFGGISLSIESIEAKDIILPEISLKEKTTVHFLTPTCIKQQNTLEMLPSFEILLRSSIRAYNRIAKFYDREHYPLHVSDTMLSGPAPVETFDIKMISVVHESMDNRKIHLEGIVGSITYDTSKIPPEAGKILKIGEYLQIGKHTTYGLGGFIMRSEGKEL